MHDLVEEVVAEVTSGDSSRFLDQALSHCEEGARLKEAQNEVTFQDCDDQEELDNQTDEVCAVLLMVLALSGSVSCLLLTTA